MPETVVEQFRPVLFAVEPHADEALYSLLARVCAANCYDHITWLTDRIGMPIDQRKNHTWTADRAAALAKLLGLPYEAIANRAYVKQGARYRFLSHEVSRLKFEWNCPKFCPKCLSEKGYHSAVFDLSAVQICPEHAVRLVTQCQSCLKNLAYGGDAISLCYQCGADIREFKCEAVPVSELSGTAAIALKAGFSTRHPDIEPPTPQFVETFGELSLLQLVNVLQQLGTYASSDPNHRRWKSKIVSHRSSVHLILTRGWSILREWPASFDRFLSELALENSNSEDVIAAPPVAFRSFYQYTAYRPRDGMECIRNAFDKYIRESWSGALEPVRRNSAIILPGQELKNEFISELEISRRVGKAQARAILNWRPPTIVIKRSKQKPRRFMKRSAAEELIPNGSALLSLKDASKFLSVSATFTKLFADQGLLASVDGPSISGNKRYLFSRSTLIDFVASVATRSVVAAEDDERVSFGVFLRSHRARGITLAGAMQNIREGKIRPIIVSSEVRSMADIRISKRDLDRALRGISTVDNVVTRSYVINTLAVNKRTVQFLIRNGHLLETAGLGKQKPILRSSFDKFTSEWIKVGDIAELYNTSRMLASRALIFLEFRSIVDESDSSVATYFDRRAVSELRGFKATLNSVAFHRGKRYSDYIAGLAERSC